MFGLVALSSLLGVNRTIRFNTLALTTKKTTTKKILFILARISRSTAAVFPSNQSDVHLSGR